jgi:hypothetical protein
VLVVLLHALARAGAHVERIDVASMSSGGAVREGVAVIGLALAVIGLAVTVVIGVAVVVLAVLVVGVVGRIGVTVVTVGGCVLTFGRMRTSAAAWCSSWPL